MFKACANVVDKLDITLGKVVELYMARFSSNRVFPTFSVCAHFCTQAIRYFLHTQNNVFSSVISHLSPLSTQSTKTITTYI
jgi:hypothetical protein